MNKKKICCVIFAVLTLLVGLVLIALAVRFRGEAPTQAAFDDNYLFANMSMLIPGITVVLYSIWIFIRGTMKSTAQFLLLGFFLFLGIGFLMECVYFQFIYFGIHQPQYKLMIPAALFILVYDVVVLIVSAIFSATYKAME